MTETLQYPAGEWTHSDFAEANGKTKPSVYNQLQSALKNGTVVKAGLKTGKGKPSQLYKVADANATVVIPTKVDEFQHGEKTVEVFDVKIVEKIVEKPAEIVETPVETVVVAEVTPVDKIDEKPIVFTPDAHETAFLCPVCKKPLIAWKDATGVMVKCVQPIEVCSSTENPYGHANTEKNAYETLCSKWAFASKGGE